MRFGMLGPVAAWTADGAEITVPERKVRTLLARLLLEAGTPVDTERLIDDLWDGNPPASAPRVLRSKVSQLRRVLEDAEPGSRDLLVHRPPGYMLRIPVDALDANRFTGLVAEAKQADDPRRRATLLAQALELWRGPALADLAGEELGWAAGARWEETRLAAIEDRAEALLELGDGEEVSADLGRLLREHPFRERARALHMTVLYRAGRQTDALESYEELRRRLVDERGLDPGPDLAALQVAILNQEPDLAAPPPAPPRGRPRSNLPAPATALVGREHLLAELDRRMPSERLVTLVGPGGVGKTRLALEAASRHLDLFPDGVWLVELAALAGSHPGSGSGSPEEQAPAGAAAAERVAELVATTLDLRDDSGPGGPPSAVGSSDVTPTSRLEAGLGGRQMLLVLDNCEHVIDAVAELTDRLRRVAPDLHILTTSREALQISGEQLVEVSPLDLGDAALANTTNPRALERAPAVRLFVARATAAAPDFALTTETAPWVATICRRLDGIPLALELAATRVRSVGIREVARRLDDRFRLLSTGPRDTPDRHRTLRAVIDWSWERLEEREQAVLRRLSVHGDTCTLEAAERICAGPDLAPGEVMDHLAGLVDKSLVVRTEPGSGEARYGLLETVAAYSAERLDEAGERDATGAKHDLYYVELAERAAPQLYASDQLTWLDRLDAESGNLRWALDGLLRRRDPEAALRLVNALAWYWYLRGRLGEAQRSLTRALAAAGEVPAALPIGVVHEATAWREGFRLWFDPGPDARASARTVGRTRGQGAGSLGLARARLLVTVGQFLQVDAATIEAAADELLEAFRSHGDRWGEAAALHLRASVDVFIRHDLRSGRETTETCLAIFREVAEGWGILQCLELLGPTAEALGDQAEAWRLAREALGIAEKLGLWTDQSYVLSRLGRLALLSDDPASYRYYTDARALASEQGNQGLMMMADSGLALADRLAGRLDEAEARLTRWIDLLREDAGPPSLAVLATDLGFVAELQGDTERALAYQREGFRAARQTGSPLSLARALEGLAGALSLSERSVEAACLLGAAAACRDAAGALVPDIERRDVDRVIDRARAVLGDALLRVEMDRGARTDPDELVREVDSELDELGRRQSPVELPGDPDPAGDRLVMGGHRSDAQLRGL